MAPPPHQLPHMLQEPKDATAQSSTTTTCAGRIYTAHRAFGCPRSPLFKDKSPTQEDNAYPWESYKAEQKGGQAFHSPLFLLRQRLLRAAGNLPPSLILGGTFLSHPPGCSRLEGQPLPAFLCFPSCLESVMPSGTLPDEAGRRGAGGVGTVSQFFFSTHSCLFQFAMNYSRDSLTLQSQMGVVADSNPGERERESE